MERLEVSSRKLDAKGTFHAMMAAIKDRCSKDLTEAWEIKKRWQGYKKNHKKEKRKNKS